jgi:hypothetical protein
MKIIDLLNKIANGEKIPKKIKYDNIIFEYDDIYYVAEHTYLDEYCDLSRVLNDEVEILDEEKKIPEKLEIYEIIDETISGLRKSINVLNEDMVSKINEITDYLKSKGE